MFHKGLRDESKGEKMRLGYRLPCGKYAWWKAYTRRVHHSVEQLVAVRNCPGGKMRRRAKARLLCSLTREFNGREDEKTNEKKEREAYRHARAIVCTCVLSLSLSLSCGSHMHVMRVTMGTGRRFKSLRIHDMNKSSVLYVRFVNSSRFVFPRSAVCEMNRSRGIPEEKLLSRSF